VVLERAIERGLGRRLFPAGSPQALALVRAAWPRALGAELACRTEVLAIEGRTLRVGVPDARWRKVLNRMQRRILSHLASVTGDLGLARIGFSEGDFGQLPEPAQPQPPRRLACVPPDVAEAAAAIADPQARQGFIDVASRYLGRFAPEDPR